jgi:hypothetical protein
MSGHPYTPLPFAKSAAEHLPKPNIDPLTTADTLTNGPLTQPERAHSQQPPMSVEPHVGPLPNVPTPTAKPATGVPTYTYKPSTQHDSSTPVYNPEGENR